MRKIYKLDTYKPVNFSVFDVRDIWVGFWYFDGCEICVWLVINAYQGITVLLWSRIHLSDLDYGNEDNSAAFMKLIIIFLTSKDSFVRCMNILAYDRLIIVSHPRRSMR